MLLQRGEDLARDKAKKPESKEQVAAVSSKVDSPKKKLTLAERNQLESLPGAMEKLKGVLGKLNAKLEDADLYTRDRKAFDDTMALTQKATAELEKMEERWLELEMLREEYEGNA